MKKNNLFIYTMMTIVSAVIQAIAMSSFSVPGNIYPSGIAGISRITSDILRDYININIPYTLFYFLINIVLSIIVFKYIGKVFTILSLLQTSLVSILASFFKPMFSLNELILVAIFGGVINGFACGLALANNASTGGLDFATIYFSNKYKKSIWNYTFGLNCLVLFIAGFFYSWERVCYSIIYQFCTNTLIKKIHKRYTHQTITIITKNPKEVSEAIFSKIRHGITSIEGIGMYKNEKENLLYTVVNSFQTDEVIRIVHEIDSKAFINVQDTIDIKGNFYQKPLD